MFNKRRILPILSMMLVVVLVLTLAGTVAAQAPDSDGDGLPDSADECTHVAGPRENNGCPVTQTGDEGIWDPNAEPAPVDPASVEPDQPEVVLPDLPVDDSCLIAPADPVGTRVRDLPTLNSTVVGFLLTGDVVPALFTTGGLDGDGLWFGIPFEGALAFVAGWTMRVSVGCGQLPAPSTVPPATEFDFEPRYLPSVGLLTAIQKVRDAAATAPDGPVPNPDELRAALGPLMGEVAPTEEITFVYTKIPWEHDDHDPLLIKVLPADSADPVGVLLTINPMVWMFDAEGIKLQPFDAVPGVLLNGVGLPPVVLLPDMGQNTAEQNETLPGLIDPYVEPEEEPILMLTDFGILLGGGGSSAPDSQHDKWLDVVTYPSAFNGGVNVAVGDVNGDGSETASGGLGNDTLLGSRGNDINADELALVDISGLPGEPSAAQGYIKVTYCPPKKWSDYCLVVKIPIP